MVGPSAQREAYDFLKQKHTKTSRVKLCKAIGLSRSTSYRKSTLDDSEVEAKLTLLANMYSTRGFDWYYQKIRQEGLKWNRKRVLRIYRKMGLSLRRKHKKRINRPYENGLAQPIFPNICWSMDFMSDALEDGRKVRILNIIDDYNRECLSIECGLSMPSQRVTRILDEIIEYTGKPEYIRTDNGPEFISHHFADWCKSKEVKPKFIQPGKPHQNGYIERFNRTYREDVLDAYIFTSLEQLRIINDKWKEQYNNEHPHKSLQWKSPIAFKNYRRKDILAVQNGKLIQSSSQTHHQPSELTLPHLTSKKC